MTLRRPSVRPAQKPAPGLGRIQKGSTLDGFLVGEILHHGGMATLRAVTGPDVGFPLLMKIPRIPARSDPAALVGFEMERLILPRLRGPHVPRFVAAGDPATRRGGGGLKRGSGGTPSLREGSSQTFPPGCRRSFSGVSRWTPRGVIRPQPPSPSTSPNPPPSS